jgi:hypothetical protein
MSKRYRCGLGLLVIGVFLVLLSSMAAEETADKTLKVKRLKMGNSLHLIQVQNLVEQDVGTSLQDVGTIFWVQAKAKVPSTGQYAVSWRAHNKKAKSSGTPFYIAINSQYALNQYCTSWSEYPYLYSIYDFWDTSSNTEYWNFVGVNTIDLEDYFNINLSTNMTNIHGTLDDCLFDTRPIYVRESEAWCLAFCSIPRVVVVSDEKWATISPRIGITYDLGVGKTHLYPNSKIRKQNHYFDLEFSYADMEEL